MKLSIKELLDSKNFWICLICIPAIFILISILGIITLALTGNDLLCYIGVIFAVISFIVLISTFIISEFIL